jgi:ribosomal protein L20A (L18A)
MTKIYVVKGRAKIGLKWERFEKTVNADGKERATDIAMSLLGGSHKVKRFQIKIESVEESQVSGQ